MRIEDWGLIDYELSSARQLERVDEIADGAEERLVVCTHPPVVTLGRATRPEDVQGWTGPTFPTSRGGRATYHGPNQIVLYPLVDLRKVRAHMRARDVHAYLRALEEATVTVLRELGLGQAEARTTQSGDISLTGVWVGEKKIASIGIAVRKWISYHGVAVNILKDEQAFRGISPCGFPAGIMTSLEGELGRPMEWESVQAAFTRVFSSAFR
jgi:lipoyl(octanoyl) transferase